MAPKLNPIPHEEGDAEWISNKLEEPGEPKQYNGKPRVAIERGRIGSGYFNIKRLPPKIRQLLIGDLLAGTPFKVVHETYGIEHRTYSRYRNLIRDYAYDLIVARSEGGKRKIEREIQWTLGVAKAGVELAQNAREIVRDANGIPVRDENGIVYEDKPDQRAVSMFLKDAHDAIDQWGDLRELTGKGADRKNARRMLATELESRKELQEAQLNRGVGMPGAPLQVFVIPKLPGVEQYPALAASDSSLQRSPVGDAVDAEFTETADEDI